MSVSHGALGAMLVPMRGVMAVLVAASSVAGAGPSTYRYTFSEPSHAEAKGKTHPSCGSTSAQAVREVRSIVIDYVPSTSVRVNGVAWKLVRPSNGQLVAESPSSSPAHKTWLMFSLPTGAGASSALVSFRPDATGVNPICMDAVAFFGTVKP